jgi:hypothetical protein
MATWNLVNADDPTLARTAISAAAKDVVGANVKDYGAVGDGVTDDTAAIAAAWAAGSGSIFFPEGDFVYNGAGLDAQWPRIVGAGRRRTVIHLGASSYLVNSASQIYRIQMRDIQLQGGLGGIKLTYTGTETVGTKIIENVRFIYYTECALWSESTDSPFWYINNCEFYGNDTLGTIGIAFAGLGDGNSIDGCNFENNRVHIKMLHGGGLNMTISKSTFVKLSADNSSGPRVDVWAVPHTTSVNAGDGFTMRGCRFGKELQHRAGLSPVRLFDYAKCVGVLGQGHLRRRWRVIVSDGVPHAVRGSVLSG